MTRKIVIVGMGGAYEGSDGEVWSCNCSYKHQKRIDRHYFMDGLEYMLKQDKNAVQRLNALNVPLVSVKDYKEELSQCEAYDLKGTMKHFNLDKPYFTSTIAYMMADAIRVAEEIVLHKVLRLPAANDYMQQKPCLDFWCGIALGRGIKVSVSDNSNLMQPFPWDNGLYGYFRHEDPERPVFNQVKRAIKDACRQPVKFKEIHHA